MRTRHQKTAACVMLLTVTLLFCSPRVYAGDAEADWWQTQRELSETLMTGGADFAELAADVAELSPKTGLEAMRKLGVLMRAGMNDEAVQALQELKEAVPQLDNYQVSSIYYHACDDLGAWDVAKATAEVFADNISDIALGNRLLKHLLHSGWTVQQIDGWLAGMPAGIRNFWTKERLRFAVEHDRADTLVTELSDKVRENPQDTEAAVALLEALIYARHDADDKWDLSWVAETIQPSLATQADKLASGLKTLNEWTTAEAFYLQALEIPLTEEETNQLAMMCAVFVPPETIRAMFATRVREGMAECLLKAGREAEAQKWMVEAADIRKEHDLGLNALFAGQVQGASGQRVIEGRIKEEEKQSEDDPRYWRERARYYRGRNEPDHEEEALLKGLALAAPRPEPPPHSRRGADSDWRRWLMADYANFLKWQNRTDEAVALLRKELEQAPADSASAQAAAHLLAFDFQGHVSVDDAVLWDWLANRANWEHTEERLLWRMLESAKPEDLDKHFARAEELAFGQAPSRANTLGWIMNRMRYPKRSIPLLSYAAENADGEHLVERARFTLFESYLDTGDWRHAEGIFPEASKRLTYKELPEWYARVAGAAAKAGAQADAMRLWRQVANLSPSYMGGIEHLVEAGLRDELIAFYHEMQKKMPSSNIPAKALMVLTGK